MTRNVKRAGFTLIEVLTVSVVLGILAGIATPALSRAIHRASAAKVVTDVRLLGMATHAFVQDGGTLPPTEDWNVAPSALNEFLEETMTFSFRDADYRFVTQPAIGAAQFWVEYPEGSGLGEALQRFRRPDEVTWTTTRTTFVLIK